MVTKLIHIYSRDTWGNWGELRSLCGLSPTATSEKTTGSHVEWCVVCIDIMRNDPPPRYTIRSRPLASLLGDFSKHFGRDNT